MTEPNTEQTRGFSRRELRRRRQTRGRVVATIVTILVVATLVIVGVLLYNSLSKRGTPKEEASTATVTRNPSPGLDGIIATDVDPADFVPGDCLTDFDPTEDETGTVIECDQPHTSQLLGRKIFANTMTYPGDAELETQAEEFCGSIQTTGQTDAVVVTVVQRPSEGSWEEGDRRLDCFAHAQENTLLSSSLIDEPVLEDLNDAPSATPSQPDASESASATPSASASPTDN